MEKDKEMSNIQKAVTILRQGGLVALPTETVYGLAADAENSQAVHKIFTAKQRPTHHPLILHVATLNHLEGWVREIPDSAYRLAQAFWPGPLTLILKKGIKAHDLITGKQDTIGIRIPEHPMALSLLEELGGPVAAPSANRFGRISPTTAAAVFEELGSSVDYILDGGPCEVGIESTIVDVTGLTPMILRPGFIISQQLEEVLHQEVLIKEKSHIRVSGSLSSHYAPITKTSLIQTDQIPELQVEGVCGLLHRTCIDKPLPNLEYFPMPETPKLFAQSLYHLLREADKRQFTEILIEAVPDTSEWDGVRDRLKRATFTFK